MTISGLIGTLLLAAVAFNFLSPELGGKPTKAERVAFARTGHYRDGEFRNLQPTEVMTGGSTISTMWKFLTQTAPHADPPGPLPLQKLDSLTIRELIGRAMPLLAGPPEKGRVLQVLGGKGLD